MNNSESNKVVYIVGGVVFGILVTLLISPMARYGGMMSWGTSPAMNSGTAMANTIDQHFIEQMIPHHDGAVKMATLALEKAQRPEIKMLATAIIESQTKEIQDMQGWYKEWFGKSVGEGRTAMMGGMMSQGGMHMGGAEDMSALETAVDFDKAFIEQMIPHHQLALMMVRMLEAGTNRPEMRTLAKNIIEAQSREIAEMQGWYKEWYK